MADVKQIGKSIVAGLESDNDEKKTADIKAIANFLAEQEVPMTDEKGNPNPTYVRGVYMVKVVQREFFNGLYADRNQASN